MARSGTVKRVADLVESAFATDETGEPSGRCGLESRADGAGACDLIHLDGLTQALHGHRPERVDLDIASSELQGGGGDEDGAGGRHLLHPRGHMGGLADRGVVGTEIAADAPHDYLTGV